MQDLLPAIARTTVWQEPVQNYYYTVPLARMTRAQGTLAKFFVDRETILMPPSKLGASHPFFHLYQIGQLPPAFFYIPVDNVWVNLVDVINPYNSIMVYSADGIVIPPDRCWLRYTPANNLVLVIEIDHNFTMGLTDGTNQLTGAPIVRNKRLDEADMLIRMYRNEIVDSPSWQEAVNNPRFEVLAQTCRNFTPGQLQLFVRDCLAIGASYTQGKGMWFLNGNLVNQPNPNDLTFASWYGTSISHTMNHDTVNYVFDETIDRIDDYPLNALTSYTSTVGPSTRYILQPINDHGRIDWVDNVDFYIVSRNQLGTGTFIGLYMNKKLAPAIMITHDTYGFDTDVVMAYTDADNVLKYAEDSADVHIFAVVRKGGMNAPLVQDSNRINLLYSLTREQRLSALAGIGSGLDMWKASTLDVAPYVDLMKADAAAVTTTLIENAFGYDTCCMQLCPTLQVITQPGVNMYLDLPMGLSQERSANGSGARVIFGYNTQGKLTGYFGDTGVGSQLFINGHLPSSTVQCEVLNYQLGPNSGDGNLEVPDGTFFNMDVVDPDLPNYDFAVYVSPLDSGGNPTEVWADVTALTTYFTYYPNGDTASHGIPCVRLNTARLATDNLYAAVRMAKYVVMNDITFNQNVGYLQFAVDGVCAIEGQRFFRETSIPFGVLDLWMDGEPLIPGLDFFVKWPVVNIVKVPSVDSPRVIVRAYSLCNPDTMAPDLPIETGFIGAGLLSANDAWSNYALTNVRTVSNGALINYNLTATAENPSQGVLLTDGKPYAISNYNAAVEGFTNKSTKVFRLADAIVDQNVFAYLDTYKSETTIVQPIIQDDLWGLFSPFMSAIIRAIQRGDFSAFDLTGDYTSEDINGWVSQYLPLLQFDPAVLGINPDFVVVFPHLYPTVVTVTADQYELLRKINMIYLDRAVDLSHFVAGTPTPSPFI